MSDGLSHQIMSSFVKLDYLAAGAAGAVASAAGAAAASVAAGAAASVVAGAVTVSAAGAASFLAQAVVASARAQTAANTMSILVCFIKNLLRFLFESEKDTAPITKKSQYMRNMTRYDFAFVKANIFVLQVKKKDYPRLRTVLSLWRETGSHGQII